MYSKPKVFKNVKLFPGADFTSLILGVKASERFYVFKDALKLFAGAGNCSAKYNSS